MPTSVLSHGGGQIVYSLGLIDIMPGQGVHQLRFGLEAHAAWLNTEDSICGLLAGEVWLNNNPASPWVGSLGSPSRTWRSFSVSSWLYIQVTDDQLIALDQSRGGGALNFRICLSSSLLQAPEGFHAVAEDEMTVSISEINWLDMLDRVGLQTGFLIRVAGPFAGNMDLGAAPEKNQATLGLAVARLRQARSELKEGRFVQCVAACRQVLENVERITPPRPSFGSMKDKAQRTLNEDERWSMMFSSVLALTQPAHHDDENTVGFTYNRAKAEAVIAATAGLLNVFTSK